MTNEINQYEAIEALKATFNTLNKKLDFFESLNIDLVEYNSDLIDDLEDIMRVLLPNTYTLWSYTTLNDIDTDTLLDMERRHEEIESVTSSYEKYEIRYLNGEVKIIGK